MGFLLRQSLVEASTDKDNFAVDLGDGTPGESERRLILTAAVFIDLQYFEDETLASGAPPSIVPD